MSEEDTPLTANQISLMSYVDDEMTPAECTEFEKRLETDAELAAEAKRKGLSST